MIASLRNDDSTGYDNATNNNLIGWIKKNNRAARAARRFPEIFIFEVLTSTRTVAVNLSFFAFTWKPFVPSAPRLFYTRWSTWNNRETLNLTQSSILKWRFRRRSRRSFLNSRVASFPGWGYSLIWVKRVRTPGQGMVFWPRCPKQGIQFDLPLS